MGANDNADKELTDTKLQTRASRIEAAVEAGFAPHEMLLIDESAKHAGHAGARPGGETHYRLRVVSTVFDGLSRVARQRLVNEALAGEFASGLHALSLELKSPEEA
ncbi:cell division protein BolA [alpha proteobacterium U9-1i]|nr:cell division protein BolA [alpha proteobacterium U9-1i]